MTSVKEFRVEEEPTADSLGRGAFVFTDDYSVFDWGKMPDRVPEKGASLCTMGAYNFELLEDAGIPTHYRGVVERDAGRDRATSNANAKSEDAEVVALEEADAPPIEMAIELTQVPDLPNDGREYDYDHYHDAAGENYLIPLEIVFRNRVPEGSSLRRRTDPSDHGLDRDGWPADAVDLEEPIVEFSTKYEESDRYLESEETDQIAGLADVGELESLARDVNRLVTEQAESAGLDHQDGKIECLYVDGEIRVADVVGTFDENRFSYEGTQLSKEVLRQYHKRTQPSWVQAVEAAKAEAKREGVADWRSLCAEGPDPLEDDVLSVARDMYCAGTNAYTQREFFDAPPLSSAVGAVRRL
ncbi:phosphoribosylaminoimidazolesuccinocarboxamide synthase [Natrarchaeobius chitinivorans]|uniref:Phosphoribosylaminoimidazole-succinocarboxamide synthase n=1 Tax=Natrarchaeobius chitinivorans TaxID=1679083 RepID=A0A3N6PDS2_NATCH|nr:phosphoribosylaminoimidazolesuccinocarboxamide synthase [Natrarchaeobius chitinivorans]RQG95215.1 phosphoribosylaminoimidazolesuccinocarboxamide synthase [Natrarchaeobius chitinivorans]